MEKLIDTAKISKRTPLNLANNCVLKPIKRQMANSTSAEVAVMARAGIAELGNQGLIVAVYFRKLSQFPHAETASGHNPNLSATADKNPKAMANRKNNLSAFFMIF